MSDQTEAQAEVPTDVDPRLIEMMGRLQRRAFDPMTEQPDLDLRRLLALTERMMLTLSAAARQFDGYATGHREKAGKMATMVEAQVAQEKATRNENAAAMCRGAIYIYPELTEPVEDEPADV
jgi:hypothetical protein